MRRTRCLTGRRAAPSGGTHLSGSICVVLQLRNVGETAPEAVDEMPVQWARGSHESVVTPEPVLSVGDQPCLAENAQLARNRGLGQIQDVHEIPDAHLPSAE